MLSARLLTPLSSVRSLDLTLCMHCFHCPAVPFCLYVFRKTDLFEAIIVPKRTIESKRMCRNRSWDFHLHASCRTVFRVHNRWIFPKANLKVSLLVNFGFTNDSLKHLNSFFRKRNVISKAPTFNLGILLRFLSLNELDPFSESTWITPTLLFKRRKFSSFWKSRDFPSFSWPRKTVLQTASDLNALTVETQMLCWFQNHTAVPISVYIVYRCQ